MNTVVSDLERLEVVHFLLDISTWTSQTPNILSLSLPTNGERRITYCGMINTVTHEGRRLVHRVPKVNTRYGLNRWYYANVSDISVFFRSSSGLNHWRSSFQRIRRGLLSHWSLRPHPNIIPLVSVENTPWIDTPKSVTVYIPTAKECLARLEIVGRLNAVRRTRCLVKSFNFLICDMVDSGDSCCSRSPAPKQCCTSRFALGNTRATSLLGRNIDHLHPVEQRHNWTTWTSSNNGHRDEPDS